MNYRYYITVNSSRVECFPLNFLKASLVDQKEQGQMFYRRKFSSTLRFYCNTKIGTSDFDILYMVEVVDNCTDIVFEVEQKDSGANTYHNYWTGHFSTTDGLFDLDNSTFDVTPLPYDNYRNFDIYGSKEYNILLAGGPDNDVATSTVWPAQTYDRNFWLTDVIEYMVQNIEPAAVIASNFLNNATNPVTNDVNKWRYLTLAQKSDIKRPESGAGATAGNLSFNDLMGMLQIFNLYWTFDGTTFRIEHYDYFEGLEGIDLRAQQLAVKSNKYDYLKEAMPMYEKFSFMEAGDTNYTPHIISYNPNCVDEKLTTEVTHEVTTDLDYIYNCANEIDGLTPDGISDQGWVILANTKDGTDYYVYYGTAYNNATPSNNYVCSWSYLLRTLFMHGRVLMSGEIERSPVDFISVIKTKKQEIKAIVCREDGYTPEDYITTELGERFLGGQKGYVHSATIYPQGNVGFTLVYGEDKNTTPTPVTKYKVINVVVSTPRSITTILTEPNTVDTYFTILFDEGEETEECYEVIIPAGSVYQDEDTATEHTVVSGLYTGDSSLTGWMFYYNGGSWTEIADCSSPPPPPGSPPVAPTLFGATQADQWECVHIGWSIPLTTSYFEIWRSIDGAAYTLVDTVPPTWDEYDDCESSNHDYRPATFCYQVKACNVAGCSAYSNEECVDVNTA